MHNGRAVRSMWVALLLALLAAPAWRPGAAPTHGRAAAARAAIRTVFVIVLENKNWASMAGNQDAPYLNRTLLPEAAHAEQYYNPPHLHPSEPNYLWLEAGTNAGITDDADPAAHSLRNVPHLTRQLDRAGIPWRSYQQGIDGTTCPLSGGGAYAPKHNPMIFFSDVTGGNDSRSPYCIVHERPYSELAGALAGDRVASYVFITPDLCHDMHDDCGGGAVRNGDRWLAGAVPPILASRAYRRNGLLLILWDEGTFFSDGPIGLLAISPRARHGYAGTVHYTHSSTLRTLQEIFGKRPFLGDAARATDLRDLFVPGTFS